MVLIPLLEVLSYVAFSFLAGYLVFRLRKTPAAEITTPRSDALAAAVSAGLVTIGPVVNLVSLLGAQNGYGHAIVQVVFGFRAGQVWLGIFVLSLILWVLIYTQKLPWLSLITLLVMLFLSAYGSHTAADGGMAGAAAHFVHLSAAVFWVGVLFQVSFYTSKQFSWAVFLRWFTPFAIVLLLAVMISGIIVMLFAMDLKDYGNALMLTYGQMLLLKHIAFIPILLFAGLNGVLARKAHASESFRPLGWIRAEAVLLAIVFICTSILVNTAPPTDIAGVIQSTGAAPVFGTIFSSVTSGSSASLQISFLSILLFIAALVCVLLIIGLFTKRSSAAAGLLFAAAAIVLLYFAAMNSIHFG